MDDLQSKISDYRDILSSHERVLGIVKTEALAIREKYGDDRRTEIMNVSGEVEDEALIPEETCVYTLTSMGYIKRQPLENYKQQRRGGKGMKGMSRREEDVADTMFTCSSHDHIMFFTTNGKAYRLKGYEIPEGSRQSKGMNVINLLPLEPEEKISSMLRVPKEENGEYLCMVTKNGIIKRTELANFNHIRKTGIIALSVKAYDPVTAQKLAEAVLARSEALVNAMSRRAQDDAIALAMSEVKTAEKRVSAAQEAMREFRNRSGMLDPASTAGGLQGIVSQLEGDAVKVRAEIAEASTYMSKDAPALVGLRARLKAVEKQLASEKLRLAGESARKDSLTTFAGEYEALQTESEFARQQLVSAMTSLETARVKAEAKSRYVVAFQIPALPDESLYPRPFLFTAYALAGSLVLAGLCSLIFAAVREHAGF